ncbi:MAG: trypsin-like peptidase domain-containing protein [Aphanocapsa sp. GSE-SYN-MK-11-07L]|nr:trypsin-like peptidase domain-containing protein [Aphanocapsa sp. GSE-SYN-MK-11-07L]
MRKPLNYSLFVALLLAGSNTACLDMNQSPLTLPLNSPSPLLELQPSSPDDSSSNFIAGVVEKVGPAVVSIDATRIKPSRSSDLNRILGRAPERRERGSGSGFILSSDGRILTNAHVVSQADQVSVQLKDGRRFQGEVIGIDPVTDIAVVKIAATGLPTVKLGNSSNLVIGQWAIAIGNPLGLSNTVTAGIVSATGRSSAQVGAEDKRVSFIQTDAAINPGNSGGPLLNQQGEVIGVNTAIIQEAQGLGFAIPIATADRIAKQLISTGRAQHLYLGIRMVDLSPELRDRLNSPDTGLTVQQDKGVLILEVLPGSPAQRAGLKIADWIAKINGQDAPSAQQVQEQVEATPLGQSLTLEVQRQGKSLQVQLQPQELPTRR